MKARASKEMIKFFEVGYRGLYGPFAGHSSSAAPYTYPKAGAWSERCLKPKLCVWGWHCCPERNARVWAVEELDCNSLYTAYRVQIAGEVVRGEGKVVVERFKPLYRVVHEGGKWRRAKGKECIGIGFSGRTPVLKVVKAKAGVEITL